jgi:hypothetical protein
MEYFKNKLQSVIEKNVPRLKNRRKRRPNWLTQKIVRLIRA